MRAPKTNMPVKEATLSFLNPTSWLTIKRPVKIRQAAKPRMRTDAGQVVLEYILLLVISVGIATYLTKRLVGRNPDEPGIITSAWGNINAAIGADIID